MGHGVAGGVLVIGPVVIAVVLIGFQFWWRGWWRRGTARSAQLIEAVVRPRLFPAQQLDLLDLQRRVVAVGLTAVTVSVTGEQRLPGRVPIEVSPSDLRRLAVHLDGGLRQVAADLGAELSRRGGRLGYTLPPDLVVELQGSAFVVDGRPRLARPGGLSPVSPPQSVTRLEADRRSATVRYPGPDDDVVPLATRRWQRDLTVNIEEASLEPVEGGTALAVGGRRTTIGRKGTDLRVEHPAVSAEHAELLCAGGRWSIVDRRSTNGTYVNGRRVSQQALIDGDRIQFAPDGPAYVFRLRTDDAQDRPTGSPDEERPSDRTVLSIERRQA